MFLKNKTYDTLKWIAQYLLPGFATLYFVLSGIWGLPYPEQIVGSIVALDVFLGTILGLSTLRYNKAQTEAGFMPTLADKNSEWPEEQQPNTPWTLDGASYDILKWTVMILIPAAGTLYFAFSLLWELPYGEQIVGTSAALSAFGGIFLGISSAKFKRG